MKVNRAAIRYSKASLEYAMEKNLADQVEEDFKVILSTVSHSNDLREFLSNPVLPSQLKFKTIMKVFSSLNDETKSIISLLSKNRRLNLLALVAENYIASYQKAKGKITALVTSAIPLDELTIKEVLNKAKKMTDFQVELKNKVDPSIIGGFILNVGDLQINASVTNKLDVLSNTLNKNKQIT
ncbi:MAG: ATP synthase F1 subunit delta [Flavobacteriaceae bacterium]|nr:ATP synthase F1 subunit delta [Flavobacteriaceae bacterium]